MVNVPVCVSGLVTTTLTAPAACAGVVAVIEVLLPKLTPVAAVPPIVTVAPDTKFVPVIVTGVPPNVVPDAGEIDVTVVQGAGLGVRISDDYIHRAGSVRRSGGCD